MIPMKIYGFVYKRRRARKVEKKTNLGRNFGSQKKKKGMKTTRKWTTPKLA